MEQYYITLELLEEFDCSHLGVVSSPLAPSLKLSASAGPLFEDPMTYRRLVISSITLLTLTQIYLMLFFVSASKCSLRVLDTSMLEFECFAT